MAGFIEYAEQFVKLSLESKEALLTVLLKEEWPKGYVLVRPNTVCHRIYFIEKGLSRTFYIKDNKDVTDWLSAENSFAGSMVSFLTQQPDRRGVELLEPSIVWSLRNDDLERLYHSYHEIERLGRLLVSHGLILMQQRFDELHFATAQERYQKLMDNHPTFLQRVPLGMIASYLGITQETLSRIRSQL